MNRKNFLQTLSLGSVPFLLPNNGISTFLTEEFQPVPKVRKDVSSLDANSQTIRSYKKAITAMIALPKEDPRNWTRQAQIHNQLCPHGNWFFLPWHRAYLYYFEQICRELSGDANFALPYWNWTKSPKIPATFWGAGNPLFDSTRAIGPNDPAEDLEVGTKTISTILNARSFENFATGKAPCGSMGGGRRGQLESGPHNYIHGTFILGNMETMMSPLDPIFWLHHANCDRLWTVWNGKGNANTSDPDWVNCEFRNHFFDRAGKSVSSIAVSRVLKTTDLGYRYDDQVVSASITTFKTSFNIINPALAVQKDLADKAMASGDIIEAEMTNADEILAKVATINVAPANKDNDEIVQLFIDGVQPPQDTRRFLRISINSSNAKDNLPAGDPHFVGFIHFFGAAHKMEGMDHGNMGLKYAFEITKNIKALQDMGVFKNDKSIRVQILSVSNDANAAPIEVKAGSIRIEVQRRAN